VVFVSKGDATSLPLPPGHPSVPGALATRAIEVPVDRPNALLGDCLALMSAICYALYVIFLKLRIRDESRIDMRLFFGFVGLVNICVGWIGIVLFHLLNIESFELPSTGRQVRGIVLNVCSFLSAQYRGVIDKLNLNVPSLMQMFITFLSDYIYVLAMLKTTPLIVTVGLSLTIPCALLGELLLHVKAPLQVVWGAILVVVAFAVIGVEDIWDSLWQKQRSSQC
jgi:solute carrier family 35 protein F5